MDARQQGVEIEIQVPCAEGQTHSARLRFTGWGKFVIVYNPCEEQLGSDLGRMARCTYHLHEEFPKAFREDTGLRHRLVRALSVAGVPAISILAQALKDSDSIVRQEACEVLGEICDKRAVPRLVRALEDPEALVCEAAYEALGQIRDERAVPRLVRALGSEKTWARVAACKALVKIGTPSVPALLQALRSKKENVRESACEALGRIGDPKAVPALIKALRDSDSSVRRAAQQAIQQIQTKQSNTKQPSF